MAMRESAEGRVSDWQGQLHRGPHGVQLELSFIPYEAANVSGQSQRARPGEEGGRRPSHVESDFLVEVSASIPTFLGAPMNEPVWFLLCSF